MGYATLHPSYGTSWRWVTLRFTHPTALSLVSVRRTLGVLGENPDEIILYHPFRFPWIRSRKASSRIKPSASFWL